MLPDLQAGCPPLVVAFEDKSTCVDGIIQQVLFDFGNGNSSSSFNPFSIYENEGLFTVKLSVTTNYGCKNDSSFAKLINVLPKPVAAFTNTPESPTLEIPEIQFYDKSVNGISWYWDFGDSVFSHELNPLHHYYKPGIYPVELVVKNTLGCLDTIIKILKYGEGLSFWIPNAFTPNNDGKNDLLKVEGYNFTNFTIQIYNRWGEKIFFSDNPDVSWNGRYNEAEAPEDVYVYKLIFLDDRSEKHTYTGHVTLIR